jgi:hypothetical protein
LWALVEAAWAPLGPEVRQARQDLVVRRPGSRGDISVVEAALPAFLDILAAHCRGLSADELTSLDRVVERKLWELDRADVHAVTGGSDDGFLYSRGLVVAMGREFYDAQDSRHGVKFGVMWRTRRASDQAATFAFSQVTDSRVHQLYIITLHLFSLLRA